MKTHSPTGQAYTCFGKDRARVLHWFDRTYNDEGEIMTQTCIRCGFHEVVRE